MSRKIKTQPVSNYVGGFYRRGCGWPKAGGTYAAVEKGLFGHPVWDFGMCPTVPVTEDFISMASIGMILKERPGEVDKEGNQIYDLFDWIGSGEYPNPLDWLLEVEALGFHQKVSPTLMQWLTEDSLYFAVHARAGYVDPTAAYATRVDYPSPRCPVRQDDVHNVAPIAKDTYAGEHYHLGTCMGLFYSDVIKGSKPGDDRKTMRDMPSFSYEGFIQHPDIQQAGLLEYQPAIFFRLPIGKMAEFIVYEDTQEQKHEDALAELDKLDAKLQRVKVIPWNPTVTN